MDQEKSSIRIVLYSSLARRDLEGIFEYTLNKWGEEQADRYIHGLLDLLTQAAKGN